MAVFSTVVLISSPASAVSTPTKAKALSAAKSKIGKPYKYGAAGPNSFDCSGLVQWSYKQAGKSLPRTTQAQYNASTHITQLYPGDLVFFGKDSKHITHVGIYAGASKNVNANTGPYRGRKVVLAPNSEYRLGGLKEYGGQVK